MSISSFYLLNVSEPREASKAIAKPIITWFTVCQLTDVTGRDYAMTTQGRRERSSCPSLTPILKESAHLLFQLKLLSRNYVLIV